MTTFAQQLIERLKPWNVGAAEAEVALTTSPTLETSPTLLTSAGPNVTDLERLAEAIGATGFQKILDLAAEEGSDGQAGYVPAWGKLLDVTHVPSVDLPYLANFVGVEIPKGASEAEARATVKREAGLERGTLASVEAAIASVTNPFLVIERTNPKTAAVEAYAFVVVIGTTGKAAAVRTAIESVKPGGLFFEVLEVKDRWVESKLHWNEVAGGLKWSEANEGNT